MKKICLLDPSRMDHHGSPSINLGDLIINRAVIRELKSIFKDAEINQISTHVPLEKEHLQAISSSSLVLVGGTNLLSSRMQEYRQWKVSLQQVFQFRSTVLLGVGWWQYQSEPDLYTTLLLNRALHGGFLHSVRDNYTCEKLKAIGIHNVINTHCPTMWPLMDLKPKEIPRRKSETVLLMLTDYHKNPELDRKLIELLCARYSRVVFWPQGSGDSDYISQFDYPITRLNHSLSDLDSFIKTEKSFDYIGTRLHGGIACLLQRKRSLIIETDNRAKEISHDTGLPTVERDNFDFINQWIERSPAIKVKLNKDAISLWKDQFKQKKFYYRSRIKKAIRIANYSTQYFLQARVLSKQ